MWRLAARCGGRAARLLLDSAAATAAREPGSAALQPCVAAGVSGQACWTRSAGCSQRWCSGGAPEQRVLNRAVAVMLSSDKLSPEAVADRMGVLSQQLVAGVASHSSTELSAFAEACRQVGYTNAAVFDAMLQQLAPSAASVAVDELPSLMWAAAQLATAQATSDGSGSSSGSSSTSSSSSTTTTTTSSSAGSGAAPAIGVPQNDGVKGSVSSSRIAALPHVLQFVLGAAQVLTAEVDEVASEELPVLASALASLEYRDPFLLTAVAEAAIERRQELSEGELLQLIGSFATMGRWFFDNRLLDQLTAEVVARARAGTVGGQAVQAVSDALAAINHRNKQLAAFEAERA